jgi:alkyl sulfatase BDS1-like metallo-beta-lactamase superfamily hydrolase
LLLPAHGLPIAGSSRIARVLDEVATALECLVESVVAMMNAGASLDEVIHSEHLPEGTLAKPYLRPLYDEPGFVVRNIWRLYGGWWDGAASRLKPAPDRQVAAVVAELSGGTDALIARARLAVDQGDLRLACHLVDFAAWSAGDDPDVHRERAAVYRLRRSAESSLMAKGIYAAAARESESLLPEGERRR